MAMAANPEHDSREPADDYSKHPEAALLSLLVPGAGQLYLGRVASGLVSFVGLAVLWLWTLSEGIFPGLVVALHAWCVLDAYNHKDRPTES
ncbi:MAG TPA: hypothetical protein VJP77_06945 [Planctomycetota bacterium]|nr:hypothetical protein [Planctomycetota bacterium]